MVTCKTNTIADFLADTWWYGLTKRLSEGDFKDLAALRAKQGFSAVQLVVGTPPEVGPLNENARSEAGFPWSLDGRFNLEYLELAGERIRHLNEVGLLVIVYGAWGHQMDWLGRERMAEWWARIVEALDSLEVVYCLCGESNLWIGHASKLLPDKTTDDLAKKRVFLPSLHLRVRAFGERIAKSFNRELYKNLAAKRRSDWSHVLEDLSRRTDRPIIVHPTAFETGYDTVSNPERLAVNTAQTGHDEASRSRLWKLPLMLQRKDPSFRGYVNLEPWYEGIRDRFWVDDQLYAYWVSMLSGAMSHCYGAHGIWNVGDGEFLSHWGKRTFAQAAALDTPRLLGLSHEQYLLHRRPLSDVFFQEDGGGLKTIGRAGKGALMQFFPDVARAGRVPDGRIWLPLEGVYTGALPSEGQAVIIQGGDA